VPFASSAVLLCCTKSKSEARAKVLFGERNFLSDCFNSSYTPQIFGCLEGIFGSESTVIVEKWRQLLQQVFMRGYVGKQSTGLVGGNHIGRYNPSTPLSSRRSAEP
jgi:hypothetical protein